MKRVLLIVALSLPLVLVSPHHALTAQQAKPDAAPAPPPATPTVMARCDLKIAWDDRVQLPELNHFLSSHPGTKEAAKKHLNLNRPTQFNARLTHQGAGTLEVTLEIFVHPRQEGARHAAAAFADAIIAALPEQLKAYQQSVVNREVGRAKDRRERTESNLAQLHAQVSHLRKRLRERTGRADATENWGEAISSLEQERQKLTLESAGQGARRQAIEATIAKITNRAEKSAKDDEIAQELAKIVALREEELQRAKQLVSVGRMNEVEIANFGAKVAEAKAKLLERRELSARAAGGELLLEFNRELLMLSINAAESEARLALIKETLDRFHDSATDVDGLKLAEKDLTTHQEAVRFAREQFTAVEDRFRDIPAPTVTVLDCDHQTLEAWVKHNPD